MPECKQCEGAGAVIQTPDGTIVPLYRAHIQNIGGEKLMCKPCDGYGRVPEPNPKQDA